MPFVHGSNVVEANWLAGDVTGDAPQTAIVMIKASPAAVIREPLGSGPVQSFLNRCSDEIGIAKNT